jgi:hypothetical protein
VVQDGGSSPPRAKITISRETTFITEPLAKDGYVDYVAALDAIGSKDVTPENNAAVLLYQAFGPKDVPKGRREHVAALLGIKPLPDEGKYFVDSTSYMQRNRELAAKPSPDGNQDAAQAAMVQFDRARERPWSKDELPLVAAWLEENRRPLDLIVAASERPRFYFPLFGSAEPTMVIDALLPMAQHGRDAARALITRAMFRLKAGKIDEAWQDVLACHRLGRLIVQGPTIAPGMVAIAIESLACQGDATIAHHGQLSAERAGRFADDLKRLPPMARMADKIVTAERFVYLDAVSTMARRGPAEMARLTGDGTEENGFVDSLASLAAAASINWDEPMRMGNAWYDRFAEAFAKPTRAERDSALEEIENDLEQMTQQLRDIKSFLGEFFTSWPGRAVSRQIGRVHLALLAPTIFAVAQAEDRGKVYSSLGQVAFALAAYRAEHGSYPTHLGQLVPKHLAAIPEDACADGPLRYQRTEGGCTVYSIGPNGKDEGGACRFSNSVDDASIPADADDVAIFMPWPEKK